MLPQSAIELAYNIALCHYKMKDYAPALKYIADVVERGIRDHPELNVGITTEGVDIHTVGNSKVLYVNKICIICTYIYVCMF